MAEWAAMWGQMTADVEREMQEKGGDADVEAFEEEDDEEKGELEGMEKRSVITALLKEVRKELGIAQNEVGELVDILKSDKTDEEVVEALTKKVVTYAAVHTEQMFSAEWMNVAMNRVDDATMKAKLGSVKTLLQMYLYKIVPYDITFPMPTRSVRVDTAVKEEHGKAEAEVEKAQEPKGAAEGAVALPDMKTKGRRGRLDVGEYTVKSSVDEHGMRIWKCPVRCREVFRSSKKCGTHLNEHLGRLYECPTCHYETYSLDNYEKHKCFSGSKIHGECKTLTAYKCRIKSAPEATVAKKPAPAEPTSEGKARKHQKPPAAPVHVVKPMVKLKGRGTRRR